METAIETHEEQETAPKQPNKWITLITEILKCTFYYTCYAVLVGTAALTAYLFSSDSIVTIIAALTAYAAVTIHRRYGSDNDFTTVRIRTMFAWTATAIVVLTQTASLHTKVHPGGAIFWSLVFGLCFIAMTASYFSSRDRYDSFIENITEYSVFSKLFLIGVIFLLSAVAYTEWATQWVWVPFGLFCVFIYTFDNTSLEFDDEEIRGPIAVAFAIGVISTIWQFFFTTLFTAYTYDIMLWQLLAAFACVGVIIGLVVLGFKYANTLKKERIEKEKQEALELEREQKAKADAEEEERRKQEIITKCQSLQKKIEDAEEPAWNDILDLFYTAHSNRLPGDWGTSWNAVSKAKLISLIEVSKTKNELQWNGGRFAKALELIEYTFNNCYNDTILDLLIAQIQELKKLKEYQYYNGIVNKISSIERLKAYIEENQNVEQ